jgi:hypothetical protein
MLHVLEEHSLLCDRNLFFGSLNANRQAKRNISWMRYYASNVVQAFT